MNQHQARINLDFEEKTSLVTLQLISSLGLAAILASSVAVCCLKDKIKNLESLI